MNNEGSVETGSQEKILSSGIQLRTSARVLKKQRLDLEASLAAESKKDDKAETELSQVPSAGREIKRGRGTITFWSAEDKNAFFEALNDAGKDLDSLEKIMRNKSKKRPGESNGPCISSKSRLQVRNFYHRTLLKICKHIQLPDVVKKTTQELYILINYGELRKRIGLINDRNAVKLKELIYCGSTQVKMKGKTWRVKTPVCRALKRLNKLEENIDELRVPLRVEILLTPRENRDKARVENFAYNPRIKATLSVETPLSNLINFLHQRWTTKECEDDQSDNLQDNLPDPGGGTSSKTLTTSKSNLTNKNTKIVQSKLSECESENNKLTLSPSKIPNNTVNTRTAPKSVNTCKYKIRIGPKPSAQLVKPNFKCGQLVTSSCISLTAHQARIGQPLPSIQSLVGLAPPPGLKASKSWAKWHKEGEPVDELVNTEVTDPLAMPLHATPPVLDATSSVLPSFTNQLAASISSSGNATTPDTGSPDKCQKTGKVCVKSCCDEASNDQSCKDESREEFESRIRKGWTLETAARLRIADLYLMFGSNGRLEVDYWFEDLTEEEWNETSSLHKLLSLAKLWYSGIPHSSRECWACGHKPNINNVTTQSNNNNLIIEDTKVEVKTEVVETPSSSTAAVVVVSPIPTTTGRFRKPLLPAPTTTKRIKSTDDTYKSLQILPKLTNRRGRYRPKNVVIQRMLPLLPKTSVAPQSCTVVTLQVLAGGPTPSSLNTGQPTTSSVVAKDAVKDVVVDNKPILPLVPPVGTNKGENIIDDSKEPFNFLTCIYNKDEKTVNKDEKLTNTLATPSSFSGLLGSSSESDMNDMDILSTPPTSPSRILKEGESQWLNSEVSDFSLSSFLGHLESPLKANGILEDTRMSADVDSQLQSLMTESSLDYTAKFADLAAKITGPGNSNGSSATSS